MRSTRERLADVLDAIAAIEEAAARGREAFSSDKYVQTYIISSITWRSLGRPCVR